MQPIRRFLDWLSALASPPQLAGTVVEAPNLLEPVPAHLPRRWEIPVLEVRYFPLTPDGARIDQRITTDVATPIGELRDQIERVNRRVINALESGSCYRRFENPESAPNLGYRIVDTIEILEPLPTWDKPTQDRPMTDYHRIMERIDVGHWVRERGVREVWLWGYHGPLKLWESNMAGPWGDVSNSDRDPTDLPVLDRTYTVYHYNYQRRASEAVEDHMHQIEAVLRHVDEELFWDRFVGGRTGAGRCGWAHYPPNGRKDYDWRNPETVLSDIDRWHPAGGERAPIDCRRWGADSLKWFVYWMQHLPADGNGIMWRGRELTNWWRFIADFDAAMADGRSLH